MKDRILTYVSLAMSVAALGYAAWVHRQAESLAEVALRERENRLVKALTPKVQQVYEGMGLRTGLIIRQRLRSFSGHTWIH